MDPYVSPTPADTRVGADPLAGERESLEGWLEMYRQTLLLKVGGLSAAQLCTASVPPSNLTLLGLVRHLTEVERYWFASVVAGEPRAPLYDTPDREGDFEDLDVADAEEDLARYEVEIASSRARAARVVDLGAPLPGLRRGRETNLRCVYMHMVEEYARHMGHADLVRERLDGVTGY